MGVNKPGQINSRIPEDYRFKQNTMLKRMDQKINAALTGVSLQAARIVKGVLEIAGGLLKITENGALAVIDPQTNSTLLYSGISGLNDGTDRTQSVFILSRGDDGSPALILADLGTIPGHAYAQALQALDRSGHIVFADDADGNGLAVPYIPLGTFVDITPPAATTTSGSFTAMQWADCYQQHPKVTASILVQTAADTSGEVRMTLGGVQVGGTITVPVNTFTQMNIDPATWPAGSWAFDQRVTLQLEARRTAGTGTVGVRALGLWGVQA